MISLCPEHLSLASVCGERCEVCADIVSAGDTRKIEFPMDSRFSDGFRWIPGFPEDPVGFRWIPMDSGLSGEFRAFRWISSFSGGSRVVRWIPSFPVDSTMDSKFSGGFNAPPLSMIILE